MFSKPFEVKEELLRLMELSHFGYGLDDLKIIIMYDLSEFFRITLFVDSTILYNLKGLHLSLKTISE